MWEVDALWMLMGTRKKEELFFVFPEAQLHSTKGQLPTLSTVTVQGRTQSGEDLSECAGLPHPGDLQAQVGGGGGVVDDQIGDTCEAAGQIGLLALIVVVAVDVAR